ncbi:ThuA domain-containing protein [Deinococcus yavapaiensis]|uniref:ThuA-like domain-containing protein n=1 Tax=Deinococcus yavapaiensis KR-236 TaxID=694435 RepID=A0A318SBL5_9DEIO|nr:ThuA domain-containing protein [Deinococcus yavapaiensis]PYE54591.1 hypothetical protein DES52_105231 [Deinococcus yavapaiensis KR-236]
MNALIVSGGWPGHKPLEFAEVLGSLLQSAGFSVNQARSLDVLDEPLDAYTLIVPNWTMGKLTGTQSANLRAAVRGGVGLAGIHGGAGDAFREDTDYQFMVGGQFVAHPGNVRPYRVNVVAHELTAGLSDFDVVSEQYYMHVDPSNTVLATTTFDGTDAPWVEGTVMPVAWTRRYGEGRVFYQSVGHTPSDLDGAAGELTRRGLLWAANVSQEVLS